MALYIRPSTNQKTQFIMKQAFTLTWVLLALFAAGQNSQSHKAGAQAQATAALNINSFKAPMPQNESSDAVLMHLYKENSALGKYDPAKEDLSKRTQTAKHFKNN